MTGRMQVIVGEDDGEQGGFRTEEMQYRRDCCKVRNDSQTQCALYPVRSCAE